jgi:hypothetical protein
MVFAGSRSTPGAVQRFHDEAVCISRLSSMVAVEGGAREGWNSLAGGRQYQLTALDQTRPFRGFQVDGEYLVPRTYSLVLDGTFAGKTVAPDGSVLLGSPAKVVKSVTPQQVEENARSAAHYVELAQKAFL